MMYGFIQGNHFCPFSSLRFIEAQGDEFPMNFSPSRRKSTNRLDLCGQATIVPAGRRRMMTRGSLSRSKG
jgi:hypothetical protein